MAETSQALKNLRGLAAVLVVSFHSVLAYVASQPALRPAFDEPPYDWLAFPVLDAHRFFGFDLYAAFLYLGLMPLMFFLSGIFVWNSLQRKGARRYLGGRVWRILLPCVLGTYLLMPAAYYPAYAATAADASWSVYWRHFLALPFWPCGPLWFLWELFAIDLAALVALSLAPGLIAPLRRWAALGERPVRYFAVLFATSAAAYLPLALVVGAGRWGELGPAAFQTDRLLLYPVYFFAGIGIGAYGYERGLLAFGGALARRWREWMAACVGSYVLWMISMAPSYAGLHNVALDILTGLALTLAVAAGCLGPIALFLRFCTGRRPATDSVSEHAYGIYLVHYVFVVWLQYALLQSGIPAVLKAAVVFVVAFGLSWAGNIAYGRAAAVLAPRRRGPSRTAALLQPAPRSR